jgi:hypothetical protein
VILGASSWQRTLVGHIAETRLTSHNLYSFAYKANLSSVRPLYTVPPKRHVGEEMAEIKMFFWRDNTRKKHSFLSTSKINHTVFKKLTQRRVYAKRQYKNK